MTVTECRYFEKNSFGLNIKFNTILKDCLCGKFEFSNLPKNSDLKQKSSVFFEKKLPNAAVSCPVQIFLYSDQNGRFSIWLFIKFP